MAFYPSDWLAGTARMTRMHRSVYLDICCYIWDYGKPVPLSEQRLMLGDLANWQDLVQDLVDSGKFERAPDGSLTNKRAIAEALKSVSLWERKSAGGKAGANATNSRNSGANTGGGSGGGSGDGTPAGSLTAEPEPEPEPESEPDKPISKKGFPPKPPKLSRPDDVSESTWSDFLALRKAKKAPLTETAMIGIKREADKIGWSLQDALAECCERGWQGFKAAWIDRSRGNGTINRASGTNSTGSHGGDGFDRALDRLDAGLAARRSGNA